MNTHKTCSCEKSFPLTPEHWYRSKYSKDGFSPRCKECVKKYDREYYHAHKEEADKRHAEWRESNREHINKRSRKWYQANKVEHLKRTKRWKENNPDKMLEMGRNHNRRIWKKKFNAVGDFTEKEFQELCQKYDNTCLRCLRNDVPLVSDHVIPLSKGGLNTIENIQPLCLACNTSKGSKVMDYRIKQ